MLLYVHHTCTSILHCNEAVHFKHTIWFCMKVILSSKKHNSLSKNAMEVHDHSYDINNNELLF